MSNEDKIWAEIEKYVDHFGHGLPEGFESAYLKDPNDPEEWAKVLGKAVRENKPLPDCEGVILR